MKNSSHPLSILHILRKPNSVIALLFIQNIFRLLKEKMSSLFFCSPKITQSHHKFSQQPSCIHLTVRNSLCKFKELTNFFSFELICWELDRFYLTLFTSSIMISLQLEADRIPMGLSHSIVAFNSCISLATFKTFVLLFYVVFTFKLFKEMLCYVTSAFSGMKAIVRKPLLQLI